MFCSLVTVSVTSVEDCHAIGSAITILGRRSRVTGRLRGPGQLSDTLSMTDSHACSESGAAFAA